MEFLYLLTTYVIVLNINTITALPMDFNILTRFRREVQDMPQEHVTVDPDLLLEQGHTDQPSNLHGNLDSKGDHSHMEMHSTGELPPLALPLVSDNNPETLSQDISQGSDGSPVALAQLMPQGSDTQHASQDHIEPSGIPTYDNAKSAHTDGHDLPLALPMTGAEHQEMPQALPQKAGPGGRPIRRPNNAPQNRAQARNTDGKPRAPPNWNNKGPNPSKTMTATPQGSVGQSMDTAGPGRRPPQWGNTDQGGPNSGGGGASSGGGGAEGGAFDPMSSLGMAAIAGDGIGDGMGGTDMFSDMMEMQRKMMFDPRYQQQYWQWMNQMQQQQYQAMNHLMKGSDGASSNGTMGGGFQYNPMLGMGDEGNMGGMNMNFLSGYNNALCSNPDSPLCKLSSMGMVETQIEGPMGEMDMEPGEMDIEGPMANMLLRQLSMGRPNVHPLHQEITLNHHVLNALQSKFGVNTTQGIQQKAKDPEFQAFMFQVLQKSSELAPGEFNANLSRADVTGILTNLQAAGSPQALPRIASSEFTHASLQDIPAKTGEPASHHDAILTVESGLGAHASPLVAQETTGTEAPHQAGMPEALVQDVLGANTMEEAGEKKEAPDRDKKTGVQTVGAQAVAQSGNIQPGNNTVITGQSPLVAAPVQSGNQTSQGTNNGQSGSSSVQSSTGNQGNTGDIKNKDSQPALSKDAQTVTGGGQQPQAAGGSQTGNNAPPPGQAPVGSSNPSATDPSIPVDNRPIGLQEAFPGVNSSEPTVKRFKTYPTATAFAIFAIVMIALAIIIGPIICMLCKMKEKHDQKKRKLRALKNRDISENNIIEAMMLHDLGMKDVNSVENEAATAGNYYKIDDTYQTIEPELEKLNKGRDSSGFLP